MIISRLAYHHGRSLVKQALQIPGIHRMRISRCIGNMSVYCFYSCKPEFSKMLSELYRRGKKNIASGRPSGLPFMLLNII